MGLLITNHSYTEGGFPCSENLYQFAVYLPILTVRLCPHSRFKPYTQRPTARFYKNIAVAMPLWRIFAHADTFPYEQRAALARDVTALYSILPAFYVNVIFVNTGDADVWVGGAPRTNFVRIGVEQVARKLLSEDTEEVVAQRKWWMDRINEVH